VQRFSFKNGALIDEKVTFSVTFEKTAWGSSIVILFGLRYLFVVSANA
jgi:hypothetical protein